MAVTLSVVVTFVIGIAPILFLLWIYKHSRALVVPFIPPGKFWQLPLIGETFSLLLGAKDDEFLNSHMNRYGRVFRSVLFGSPTISVTSAETVKFVLGNPDLFKSVYTPSFEVLLLGREDGSNPPDSPFVEIHRAVARKKLTPERFKGFIPVINKLSRKLMESWQERSYINTLDEASKFTFMVGASLSHESLNDLSSEELEKLRQSFTELGKGLWSFQTNYPGTVYYNGKLARKHIMSVLIELVDQRRAEKGAIAHDDMTDAFLEMYRDPDLTSANLANSVLASMFGALETGAVSITWFIHDLLLFPHVFGEVYKENMKLAELRAGRPDDSVTYEDINERLPATHRALQETLRFRSAILFTLREASKDVLRNGILYPKGWKVMVWLRAVNMDPANFEDPHIYNPSRFKNAPKPNCYVPFGNGPRTCPGKDFFRAEALVFAHYLITNFKIQPRGKIDPNKLKVKFWPLACPKDGVPINIEPRPQIRNRM